MRLVVGLGNPGDEYENTRHNIGFAVVDELAARLREPFRRRGGNAMVADGRARTPRPFLLVKPMTYMNRSGEPLKTVMKDVGASGADVLVVVDDFHLDLGRLRCRKDGSEGGHNGLRSISQSLGSREYARLRIGIGPAPERVPWEDFVLHRFKPAERDAVQDAVTRASEACEDWLAGMTIDDLMNRYNLTTK